MATHSPTHAVPGHGHHVDPRPLWYWWRRAIVWTGGGVAFSFAFTWFFRWVFGMQPLWNPEVYVTFATLFGTLGFLAGIGCFDYWAQYVLGKRLPEDDHSLHGAHSWRDYLRFNTDHKVIGVQYVIAVFFFFVVGGIFALLVRAELADPGQSIGDAETYNLSLIHI